MIKFKAIIHKFGRMGEKTNWNYIEIPLNLADTIKKDTRKGFRVKGTIDSLEVEGLALLPMGDGNFIIPINTQMRKKLKKEKGDELSCSFEEDKNFKIEMPIDLEDALLDEKTLMDQFFKQPKSHQNYFIKWIDSAKTENTRSKRIGMTVEAMYKKYDFGKMIREEKKNKIR